MIIDFFKIKNQSTNSKSESTTSRNESTSAKNKSTTSQNQSTHPVDERYISDLYFKQMESINVHWAVISNLRAYFTDEARDLELLCLQNIQLYRGLCQNWNAQGMEQPHHAPAYVRLSMLYEKQKRFEDAIEICRQAIDDGAYEDGSKGKMYGRLARLIRKAAEQIPDDQVIEQHGK